MRRDVTSWHSERLHQEMPMVAYGHAGFPVLMLPTAAADFLEYERFYVIDAVQKYIETGRARIYSVNSVNRMSLLNHQASPQLKVDLLTRYDGYLTQEVLPLIRHDCGDPGVVPLVAGISLGAYLAGNTFFRHPDLLGGVLLLSGSYDIRSYLDGHYDTEVYFHNLVDYLPNLNDDYFLPILQRGGRRIIIFSGQGDYEAPERSRQLSGILNSKGIPHELDIWGHDVNHDWPWWRKAMDHHFGRLFA